MMTSFRIRSTLVATVLFTVAAAASAGPNWQAGRINNVTVSGDTILLTLDSGLPDDCANTAYGWLMIPPPSGTMVALELALWARGDAPGTTVSVSTTGLDAAGYCQIT